MRRAGEILLSASLGAVLWGLVIPRPQVAAVEVPVAVATPPVVVQRPIHAIGHQLLECREMRVRAICTADRKSESCARAVAATTGDGIFYALRDVTDDNLCDVVARVDAAMLACAEEMGISYERRVWYP